MRTRSPYPAFLRWLGPLLAVAGFLALLFLTPGGLLRKADYIAAAVCHRRPDHSSFIAGVQLPLCQRCSGTFPGALTGLLVQWAVWRRRRSLRFPPLGILAVLVGFALLWGLDGLNSTTSDSYVFTATQFLWERPPGIGILGYHPQPWLRLFSGMYMGLAMSAILVPAFNQTMWADGEETRTLRGWRELGILMGIETVVGGLFYFLTTTSSPLALYMMAVYGTAAVIAMFVCLGAMLFVLGLCVDATLNSWHEARLPLIWGVVFAWAVIGVMVALRLWSTGTVDGVPGLSTMSYFVSHVIRNTIY